jgi:hypothetical protein
VTCWSILGVLASDGSSSAVVIAVLGAFVAWTIYRWIRRRTATPPRSRTRQPATKKQRCHAHHDKVEFATEVDAERFVAWTQQRYAAGRWSGKPMDHSYRCPVAGSRHWHVSSKPRRPW